MGAIFDRMTNDEAVLWYGVTGLLNTVPCLVSYLIWRDNPYVRAFQMGVILKQALWWPVVLTWFGTLGSDSKLTKRMLDNSVSLSILDPYGGAWVALNTALIHLFDNSIDMNASAYSGLSIWVVITIWEMVMQAHFLPKIFAWVDTEEEDDSSYQTTDIDS